MSGLFDWTLGSWRTVGFVALSTLLIYVSVVVALRVGERRTLAEMSGFDFAVAVAVGSIIGRVSTARSPTYVQGLAALVTLLVSHYLITFARARSARLRLWLDDRRRWCFETACTDGGLAQRALDRGRPHAEAARARHPPPR
jgi:hypothetical protein